MTSTSPFKQDSTASNMCGFTLMNNQIGAVIATVLDRQDNVTVQHLPSMIRVDGTGKFVTPGVIDIHSHLGDYPTPSVQAHSDGNEATSPTTPEVWAEHSVWPQDPGFTRALANGGVTALQILPGSANLTGGRSVTLKNVSARTVQGMKFPGAPYGMKMACGENPKRVYGSKGRMPSTRMGNFAVNRQMWLDAQAYDGEKRDLGKQRLADWATVPQMEACLQLPEGESKLVIVAGQPIEIGDEKCMLFTFADLEPRRKAESALRNSEEKFAKTFRLAPVPIRLRPSTASAFSMSTMPS